MTAELTEDEATAHLPLQIGDEMVNFSCDSTMGMFNPFHDVIDGHWSVLVTFPKDFDPVGTTELGHMAKLREEFEARNVKLFALSCDTKMSHRRWIDETQELQECSIGFPMIVDDTGEISRLLGLVRPKVEDERRLERPLCLCVREKARAHVRARAQICERARDRRRAARRKTNARPPHPRPRTESQRATCHRDRRSSCAIRSPRSKPSSGDEHACARRDDRTTLRHAFFRAGLGGVSSSVSACCSRPLAGARARRL